MVQRPHITMHQCTAVWQIVSCQLCILGMDMIDPVFQFIYNDAWIDLQIQNIRRIEIVSESRMIIHQFQRSDGSVEIINETVRVDLDGEIDAVFPELV